MRDSRDEREEGRDLREGRQERRKGFRYEHVSLGVFLETGGRRCWMTANECLNGKNLLIMA